MMLRWTVCLPLRMEVRMKCDQAIKVVFTVRAKPDASSPILMQAVSEVGSSRVVIRSEDTRGLNPGRYSADMQLNTGDGRHYTFWPTLEGVNRYAGCNFQNFVIMPEVTI